jgi:hypothetical protein
MAIIGFFAISTNALDMKIFKTANNQITILTQLSARDDVTPGRLEATGVFYFSDGDSIVVQCDRDAAIGNVLLIPF